MDRKHGKRRHGDGSPDESHTRKHNKHHNRGRDYSEHHSHSRDEYGQSRRRRRDDTYDPNIRVKKEKDAENYADQQRERAHHDANRLERRRDRERNGESNGMDGRSDPEVADNADADVKQEPKENPNFGLSGKLTEDTNTFRGVVIKYNEPPEAMTPKRKWRLYPFKGETALPVLHIHRQSAFLLGRERKIADIPVDHPSCSKQHAVLQFRAVDFVRDDGTNGRRVRPFIIDLESANGTYLNSDKLDPRRYYELREKDVLKFGFSTREYVILHDNVDLSEVSGTLVDEL